MKILVNSHPRKIRCYESPYLDLLVTPHQPFGIQHALDSEYRFAVDNGAFGAKGFSWSLFWRLLERCQGSDPYFVAVPDVVADRALTLQQFAEYGPKIRQMGFKIALVTQDQMTVEDIELEAFDALFVGGSDRFKFSRQSYQICQTVKQAGKLLHIGRVNSYQKLVLAQEWGADTVDGLNWSRFTEVKLAKGVRWLEYLHTQPRLFELQAV